jgi:hypothetical protein
MVTGYVTYKKAQLKRKEQTRKFVLQGRKPKLFKLVLIIYLPVD